MKSTLLFTLLLAACSSSKNDFPNLALGKDYLEQKVSVNSIEKGIRHIQVQRGSISNSDFYTLSSGILPEGQTNKLIIKLKELGLSPRIEFPLEKDPHGNSLGSIIRVGKFKTTDDASELTEQLENHQIKMSIRHTTEDGKSTTGPFQISLLEIDLNKFEGKIKSVLGKNKIRGKELTSEISKQTEALAAVNGGFFAWDTKVGVEGDPSGISIIDGTLVSESINGRSAVIIDNNVPKGISVAHNVHTEIQLRIKDKFFKINGINREVGRILNCGNTTDSGSEIPVHDFICQNENEIVLFNTHFGKESDFGQGLEFTVDKNNIITSFMNTRGGEIPKEGFIIQATGSKAEHLKEYLLKGLPIEIEFGVESDEGPIELKAGIYAINGGPTLLRKGKIHITDRSEEGWETQFQNLRVTDEFVDRKDRTTIKNDESNGRLAFYYDWIVRRHPRTAIGITEDNIVYMVVVYGRQPGISAGASITEMSDLLKSIGVTEALNLDGGGSSMMIVNEKKTGKSSDLNGERAVGDALILVK